MTDRKLILGSGHRAHPIALAYRESMKMLRGTSEWEARDKEFLAMLKRLEADMHEKGGKIQKLIADARAEVARLDALAKSMKATSDIAKSRQSDRLRREAIAIREALRKADAIRRDGRLARMPHRIRCEIQAREKDARKRLAKIEAQLGARSSVTEVAAKHHRAMIARGVTFDRMTAVQ